MVDDSEKNRYADDFKNISIKMKNYMCFGGIPQGFESIKPINIIIGRNNSGKSRLLDMLQFAAIQKNLKNQNKDGKDSEIIMSLPLIESELKMVFPESTSSSRGIGTLWDFGKKHIGNKITISLKGNMKREFISLDPPFEKIYSGENLAEKSNLLAGKVRNPLQGKIIKKINAERNIGSEAAGDLREVQENGSGATNIMRVFWHHVDYLKKSTSAELLNDLNEIVYPDVYFEEINLKEQTNKHWEIFLKERGKGIVSLSNSGSGLKTILLVLINILLIPEQEVQPLDKYIFIFEELENNLHPAVQRRLLSYIKKIALEKNATFFITTHSNVVIDSFSKDPNAQIYHIMQNNGETILKHITTYIEASGILDDLDIRASDLLQSNGLIWVEGPSDRIYMNKFIELWSGGTITEGLNYQCIFYGGRIRAHLTADIDDGQQRKLFEILLTNRNAIMLMDSDKKSENDGIDGTKKRIKDEFGKNGRFCWTTEGRTIENYIPQSAMESLFDMKFNGQLGKYDDYRVYLGDSLPADSQKFYKTKVLFAEKIRPYLKKEDLEKIYDLDEKMVELIADIKKWNKIQ